jgi:hypothetical protein
MNSITKVIGGKQYLFEGFHELQQFFEEQISKEHWTFIHILHIVEEALPPLYYPYAGNGRRPYEHKPFVRAFLALSYFGIASVSLLIKTLRSDSNLRQLCGFTNTPSNATFSRRLRDLSGWGIADGMLSSLVKRAYGKLPIIHVCRDSSAIPAREKPVDKTTEPDKKPPKKRGRPVKGTPKPVPELSELKKQKGMDAERILATLNTSCSWGCKQNSQGKTHYWKGYKLHPDVSDIGFPLTAYLTGANVHDSRLAIPMEKLTGKKVKYFYSVMDAAYDAKEIISYIRCCRRVPIIDPNRRRDKNRPPLDPAKQERYKIRTTVERAYSRLKDSLIPKSLFVKGHAKISFLIMMGIVCLAALKYLRYFSPASG